MHTITKTSILTAFFLFTCLILTGCLVGHSIIYEVNPHHGGKGTATIIYTDIRSNAPNDSKLEEDKTNLFNYMLKSPKFVNDMRKEGKDITSRNLFIENGKLNGKAVYKFNQIGDVEKALTYEDGFYYLTLQLDDSVAATNGIILKSANYKRILWDSTFTDLKFEIITEPAGNAKLVDMAQFYKPNE